MSQANDRIYLSPPHMGGNERRYVEEAFETNWLSTVGPNINAFEEEFEAYVGRPSVALGSGTAAIHLGLRLLGVGEGDEVVCPTLTFVATVNPVVYLNAKPVFVDSEADTWNLCPKLFEELCESRAKDGKMPKAVIPVHLYGQPAKMDEIAAVADHYGVAVLEDAAEGLGARYKDRPAGSLAPVAAFSFNGNKIITTTGGGMLVAEDRALIDKARFWSTQARDPGIAYHHTEMGYNYRLSNVLAGIGRGQLEVIEDRVARRREIAFRYQARLAERPGLTLMPQAEGMRHTNWLSVFTVNEEEFGASRNAIIENLTAANIESRPVWKPMHLQPLYADALCVGGDFSKRMFEIGICLPSGSSMTEADQDRVIDAILATGR